MIMKKNQLRGWVLAIGVLFILGSCEKADDEIVKNDLSPTKKEFASTANENAFLNSADRDEGFVHGLVVDVYGQDYYFAGVPDGPNGAIDVPGHYWVQSGPDKLVGKHYNTGPFGSPQWWSSDAPDGDLLYVVHGIIDEWTEMKAKHYSSRGFVHYHEFISTNDGRLHPSKVVWLKHTAVTSFTLDGGPGAPNPPYEHEVTPGVDLLFPNNYMEPYDPQDPHDH
jgi:selenium-binding protein 1